MTAIRLGGMGFIMFERDAAGEWPEFADGGYPLIYYTKDGTVFCGACANGKNESDAHEDEKDPQWKIVGADVFYEGPSLACEHCDTEIESAYGDPEERESDADEDPSEGGR